MPHPPIFISYRRYNPKGQGDNGQGFAGQLRGELESKFGKGSVFIDYQGIESGTEWAKAPLISLNNLFQNQK